MEQCVSFCQLLDSLSSGFLLISHTLLFFLAVSIIFSDALVPVELFALLFLKFPGLFRTVGISFSNALEP